MVQFTRRDPLWPWITRLVLQAFLRIAPSTIPFEAAPLLTRIGDSFISKFYQDCECSRDFNEYEISYESLKAYA